MLPIPPSSPISLRLRGHEFVFRRLTWREEVAFARRVPNARRVDYVAYAMTTIDGKATSYEQALQVITNLPRPISERVVIFYLGSLPARRLMDPINIYVAPDPVPYRERVEIEEAEAEDAAEKAMVAKFGHDEVAEANALASKMAQGTHFAGATPATTSDLEPDAVEAQMGQPPPGPAGEVGEADVVYHFDMD